jgi:hypothetical protein
MINMRMRSFSDAVIADSIPILFCFKLKRDFHYDDRAVAASFYARLTSERFRTAFD